MFHHESLSRFDIKSVTNADGVRHYATPDGIFPSITTVLGSEKPRQLIEWQKAIGQEKADRIKHDATTRGKNLHIALETYLNNRTPESIQFPSDILFRQIKPILDSKINNIRALEFVLWSKRLQIAGCVDCVAEYDGVLSIIDFKTSSKVKPREQVESFFMQTAAYSAMLYERTGLKANQLVIIIANLAGQNPQVYQEKACNYFQPLLGLIKRYNTK